MKDRLDAMNSSTHISNQVVEKERSQSVINLEIFIIKDFIFVIILWKT